MVLSVIEEGSIGCGEKLCEMKVLWNGKTFLWNIIYLDVMILCIDKLRRVKVFFL